MARTHLIRTLTVIEECEKHLAESGATGSPVDSYLAEHVLVLLCADMQGVLYDLATERALSTGDSAIQEFVTAASRRVLRSVEKNAIASFLGLFGSVVKETFNASLGDREVTLYNNGVQQRHQVAHSSGTSVTFLEVREVVAAAQGVLRAAEGALTLQPGGGQPPPETSTFPDAR